MVNGIEVQGMDKVMEALKKLSPTKQELVEILTPAAVILQESMFRKAPIDEGRLQQAIIVKDVSEGDDIKIGIGVFEPETVNYAIFQEFGTGKYATGPGGSRAKRIPWLWQVRSAKWAATFGIEVGDSVLWYGNHPHPFVRPAWDEEVANVKKLIESGAATIIKNRAVSS